MPARDFTARHFATGQPVHITCAEGRIQNVEDVDEAPSASVWIAPPLFDLQINGYAGVDFQQDDVPFGQLLHATRKLRADGCSRFLLTLITDDWTRLTARLKHFVTLRAQSEELRRAIAGWHIEGPFLSPEPGFHGAHNPAAMRDPKPQDADVLREITGDDPLLLTLAPERDGALETIRRAVSLNATVSLGHTNASANQIQQAVNAGATGFTHLGNGCPSSLDRHDNILWRVLECPDLTISLIPDRIHVSPALFRILHRLVNSSRLYYTTDAMAAAGAPPGRHRLGATEVEVGEDRIVRQPGKTNFAGSALRPIEGVFRSAEMLHASWRSTWKSLSITPASFLGLPHGLEPGQPAEFCLVEADEAGRFLGLTVITSP